MTQNPDSFWSGWLNGLTWKQEIAQQGTRVLACILLASVHGPNWAQFLTEVIR